jgi:hypothetical protein
MAAYYAEGRICRNAYPNFASLGANFNKGLVHKELDCRFFRTGMRADVPVTIVHDGEADAVNHVLESGGTCTGTGERVK